MIGPGSSSLSLTGRRFLRSVLGPRLRTRPQDREGRHDRIGRPPRRRDLQRGRVREQHETARERIDDRLADQTRHRHLHLADDPIPVQHRIDDDPLAQREVVRLQQVVEPGWVLVPDQQQQRTATGHIGPQLGHFLGLERGLGGDDHQQGEVGGHFLMTEVQLGDLGAQALSRDLNEARPGLRMSGSSGGVSPWPLVKATLTFFPSRRRTRAEVTASSPLKAVSNVELFPATRAPWGNFEQVVIADHHMFGRVARAVFDQDAAAGHADRDLGRAAWPGC